SDRNNAGLLSMAFADTDNDGDLDILTAGVSDQKIAHWRNDGSDTFTQLPDIAFPLGGLTFIAVADYDGDGDPDIFGGKERYGCNGRTNTGQVFYFANRGAGTFELRDEAVIDIGNDVDTGVVLNLDNDENNTPDFLVSDGNNSGTYGFVAPEVTNVYNLAGRAQSLVMVTPENEAIVGVELDISDSIPSNTGYSFYVSNDDGLSWELVNEAERYGGVHTFKHFGNSLRWRVDMFAEASVLNSDEAAFAPASKYTPRIFDIEFDYQIVDKRRYSRSGLTIAQAKNADGDNIELVVGAGFEFPGFDGYLSAYDITNLETSTSESGELESVTRATTVDLLWEAGDELRGRNAAARTIYAGYDSAGDGAVSGSGDMFSFTSSNAALFASQAAMTTADASTLINRVRGGMERGNSWKLLDPGHSTPIFVGSPDTSGNSPYYAVNGYPAFQQANSGRDGRVYLASNGGMIHSFNVDNGAEEWAFIPNNLLARLKNQNGIDDAGDYSFRHTFLVDGQQTVIDIRDPDSSTWRTILVSGQGQGAGVGDNNYYFAIDITDPNAPEPLWEFSDDWNNGLLLCSGEETQENCETTCDTVCDDSCTRIDHVFIPSASEDIWMESENASTNAVIASHEWIPPSSCPSGSSGGCLAAFPDDGATCNLADIETCGAQLTYSVSIAEDGDYDLWVRGASGPTGGNEIFAQVGPNTVQTLEFPATGAFEWVKAPSATTLVADGYSVSVYMKDAGVRIDKLLLTRASATPSGTGDAEVCNEECTPENCNTTCSTITYGQDEEWPECGVGSGMRCCLNQPNVCRPIGEACVDAEPAAGETWSKPAIGPVRVQGEVRFVVFFGSGYNNLTDTPNDVGRSLYAVDALTG
ncbi:MAG: PilC/PilY family type IV pilus protein, partial [Myxococcota bacterium]